MIMESACTIKRRYKLINAVIEIATIRLVFNLNFLFSLCIIEELKVET